MQLLRAKQRPNPLPCFLEDGVRASSRGRALGYREASDTPQCLSDHPAHREWGRGKERTPKGLGRAAEGRAAESPDYRAVKNI